MPPCRPAAVLAGSKTFTLLPPADAFRMRMKRYPQATYKPAAAAAAARPGFASASSDSISDGVEAVLSGTVALEPVLDEPGEEVLWSSVVPAADAAALAAAAGGGGGSGVPGAAPLQGRDLFSDPSLPPPITVTVKAGEALYLPAMWWHQVRGVGHCSWAGEHRGAGSGRRAAEAAGRFSWTGGGLLQG